MQQMNDALMFFPGATSIFDEEQMKDILFDALPIQWRTNFINADLTLENITIERFRGFMTCMENQQQQVEQFQNNRRQKNQNYQKGKQNRYPRNSNSNN
jgi:hypothetical protein